MAVLLPTQRPLQKVSLESLFTLDIESSGSFFDKESYPVSLGVAGPFGKTGHWLIKPAKSWTHWDEISEEIHGISLWELEESGFEVAELCHELNRRYAGQVLIVDSLADLDWSAKLFDSSKVLMEFDIGHLASALALDHAVRVLASIDDFDWPHRADADANMLRNAILAHA